MVEVGPEERQVEQVTGLTERAATLERENEELKKALQVMEAKPTLQENTFNAVLERFNVIQSAITQIIEHVRYQEVFNASARNSISGLETKVRKHQDNFFEVVRIFKKHDEFILKRGAVADEMAKNINVIVEDAEKKCGSAA